VTATAAGGGPAIGADAERATVSSIEVAGGALTLNSSGAGIGAGSSLGRLTIHNGAFDCTAVTAGACLSGSAVVIGTGSSVVIAGSETVLGSPNTTIEEDAEAYFQYVGNSSEEQFEGIPMIHVGSILLPYPTLYALTIGDDGGFEREIIFDGNRFQGGAFSVPSIGKYSLAFRSVGPGVNGILHHNASGSFGATRLGDNFYSIADYTLLSTPNPTPTSQFVASAAFPASADVASAGFPASADVAGSGTVMDSTDRLTSSDEFPVSNAEESSALEPSSRADASNSFTTSANLSTDAGQTSSSVPSSSLLLWLIPVCLVFVAAVIVAVWVSLRRRKQRAEVLATGLRENDSSDGGMDAVEE
jgi:hypothetical protein